MSQLEKNVANIVDLFYHNESLIMLEDLIAFLEQTYNDASHKYIAMIKLEIFQQKNHEFTSFFSEFLSLVDELN